MNGTIDFVHFSWYVIRVRGGGVIKVLDIRGTYLLVSMTGMGTCYRLCVHAARWLSDVSLVQLGVSS